MVPGADLMLLHPDGKEELLVSGKDGSFTIGNVPPATTGITVTAQHKAFFLRMPKVELHCHLLGTVRQKTFEALLDKHRAPLSREDVAGFYRRDGKPVGVLRGGGSGRRLGTVGLGWAL